MQKYAPNESFPQDINDTSNEQVPNHNSGQEGVPQSSRISSNAEITLPHGTTHLYHLTLGYLLKRGFSTRYSLVLFASPLPEFFLCPAHPLLVVQCADPVTLGCTI
ncbi:hypothetical protein H5410_061440 [Solanum commersonii]|uniref:Uncharacterized protein n=1 Tax=Solanum commersonii TaxID=4109 RepID=A0A9J5W802_SOLCO|nr:hypothetical protein H5410_061440 [Solanum commersonii]